MLLAERIAADFTRLAVNLCNMSAGSAVLSSQVDDGWLMGFRDVGQIALPCATLVPALL
jgi:hypothetical protein